MPTKPEFPLRVYYDGSCIVCSSEVEHYGRMDRNARLVLVDISSPEFEPAPLGITLGEFMYQMHVIDRTGKVYRNIDAFWAIWQVFPASTFLGLLGMLITMPLVKPCARLCYRCFAGIRRYLPKRTVECSSGSCRIGKGNKR